MTSLVSLMFFWSKGSVEGQEKSLEGPHSCRLTKFQVKDGDPTPMKLQKAGNTQSLKSRCRERVCVIASSSRCAAKQLIATHFSLPTTISLLVCVNVGGVDVDKQTLSHNERSC